GNRVRIAIGIHELEPRAARAFEVEHAPARLLPVRLPARVGDVRHTRAAFNDARAVVVGVAERRDVEIGDVSERKRSHMPARILKDSPSGTSTRRLSATVWCHSSPFAPGIL